jgi:prepilin-type processing-associated H-X9-DG protein
MNGVRMVGLPEFRGPLQFFKKRGTIRRRIRAALQEGESLMFRVPGVINTAVLNVLGGSDRPFGVEVLGDPRSALGTMRHSLRRLFQWYYARDMRRRCQQAFASAYVTRYVLQNMYPPDSRRFSTSYSDVQVRESDLLDHPREDFPQGPRYRLIMVGTLSQMYKGHDVLLKALARLPKQLDYELAIVGSGTFRPSIEKLAADLGLGHRVVFLGEIAAGDAVRTELDKADLFLMPSRSEGLPRALIEAMARGLPCIGSNIGGIPELLPQDADGKPLHSWRTLILPYLEQKELYDQIDLSKPWDDPTNEAARNAKVATYVCPSGIWNKPHTSYFAVVAHGGCFKPTEPTPLAAITDKASETLMVIEVPEKYAVHWMSPHDATEELILERQSDTKFAHPNGSMAAFVDGHTAFLTKNTPAHILRALISISGNEEVGDY